MKYIWYIIIIALLVLIFTVLVVGLVLDNWDFNKPPKPVTKTNNRKIEPRPEKIPYSPDYGWDNFEENGKL